MVAVREDVAESAEPGAWRRRVDGVLPRSAGAGRLPGYLAASVGAVGFQLFTPAGLTHLNHVWAEDGARFLVDALREPLAANLVAPYGGYLHTVPRLVAELVSVLPLSWAAVAIAIAVALLRTGVALLVFAASGGYLRAVPVRIGLAALVIVLPAGNSETLGNLANLHWFLLYGAFWAVLWRPASLGLNVLAAAVVLLAGLSSPLVFLLAPLALLRLALPAWRERLSALAFGVALVGQVVAVLLGTRAPYSNDAVDPVQVLLASLLRGPVVAFTGSEQVARVYPRFGNWPVLAAVVLALVPIALAVVRGDGTRRFLAWLGAGYGGLIIVIVLVANWSVALQVQQPGVVLAAQRYSVAPCLFLLTAVAAGLDLAHRHRATVVTSRVIVGVVLSVSIGLHMWTGAGRLNGVPWGTSVTEARQQCTNGEPEARLVHEPAGWFFVVPCDVI
jgi:hypothetical protein